MTNPNTDQKQPLAALRNEIDRIDHGILDLLAQRMKTVETIAQQKSAQGLVFRARREVEKTRELDRLAQQLNVPRAMVFDIWRTIISTSSHSQRPFALYCFGSPMLEQVALAYFGRNIPTHTSDNLDWVLEQQQKNPDSVMCLFDRQNRDWWQKVITLNNGLSVVAELPWQNQDLPDAYLLAHCPPDLDTDADVLCTLHAPQATEEEINTVFADRLLHSDYDPKQDRWLIKLHDPNTQDSITEMLECLRQPLPENWQLDWLGRYPRFQELREKL